MRNHFKGKDFLTLMDFSQDEIGHILKVSYELKMKWASREPHEYLRGRTLAALFEKESTRTRTSFQAACAHLGAQSFYMRPGELQLSRGESVKDTARVIDRYCDGLFLRSAFGTGQDRLNEFAKYMDNPVINACTDYTHPCQALADLLTIWEHKGRLEGLKIAWSGDPWNVCHSDMIAGCMMGSDVYAAFPEGFNPDAKILEFAKGAAKKNGRKMVVTRDLKEALTDADVIIANTWHSMGFDGDKERRSKAFTPYQINKESVKVSKSDFIFMHPGPYYPGEEVTSEIIEGPHSVIYDQAENRMHTEKGVLVLFVG